MSLKTQAAFPYALETPNWDYGQVAVGMGDNAIKLWNFSSKGSILEKMRPSYYKATTLWKGLQGKIEKIRWHPTREGLLAFGNDLGHIGILNVTDTSRQMFKIFHNARGAPYIDWGGDMATALNCADMTNTLMSCGQDGVIHAYDANNPKNPPFNINEKIRDLNAAWVESLIAMETFPFCIKIDEQHRFIAVGHNTGLVEVYNLKDLKVIYVSNYHRQLIKALDWKCRVLLASGASDGTIAVHDINTHDLQNLPDIPVPRPEPAYRVNGHRNGINELKWGPHKDKCLLASASDDSFAIVWSIPDCKAVSLFNKHRYRVLSISWNLEEPNFIFTGSEDRFIYEWNYTDFLANTKLPQETPATRQLLDVFNEAEKMTSKLRKAQYCLMFADSKLGNSVKKASEKLLKTYLTEEQRKDSVITKYGDFWSGTRFQTDSQRNFERIYELFFGNKNDIRQLINLDAAMLKQNQRESVSPIYTFIKDSSSQSDTELVMDMMRCQLDFFQSNDKDPPKGLLSDWIAIAFSPMAGKQKWMELLLKQATKLEAEKQYNLAASCYIACSHIKDAVELYKRHDMFLEAIVLAKLRLPAKDPTVQELLGVWAKKLQMQEQDLLAATW
ncbi:WD40-repeat-containing domain protein [Mycotypha africana]|uniref:WD40-repeat-containing domain protein n=1 Tax=Mycotypha africana TaxID=64632 RepID=UPI002301D514|nr:WD40-repeat-containing domain protein [Mycotypha africana]KAI8987233.1 WD40-repeat-containing domain protein [Mycotypha africana]